MAKISFWKSREVAEKSSNPTIFLPAIWPSLAPLFSFSTEYISISPEKTVIAGLKRIPPNQMNSSNRLYLIGFMGAGKTTLGQAAAKELDWGFIDLDHWIEEKVGQSVQTIFTEQGESAFRREEQAAIDATGLQPSGPHLIACGGGTPCFGNNMQRINALGTSVYLKHSPAELAKRLAPFRAERPLIRDLLPNELETFITKLLKKREPFYQQAHHCLQGSDLAVQQLTRLARFSLTSP
jgi:shikimate kinase